MKKAKQVLKVLGLFVLIAVVATIVLFLMWKQNESIKRDGIRIPYLDDVTRFEVHYPYKWGTSKSKVKQDEKRGFYVYVNKDETEMIYCYYTDKTIDVAKTESKSAEIETTNGLKGTIFNKEENGREIIDVVFEGQKYGIHIDISEQNWSQYEEAIMKIIKSFVVIQ